MVSFWMAGMTPPTLPHFISIRVGASIAMTGNVYHLTSGSAEINFIQTSRDTIQCGKMIRKSIVHQGQISEQESCSRIVKAFYSTFSPPFRSPPFFINATLSSSPINSSLTISCSTLPISTPAHFITKSQSLISASFAFLVNA